jgi:anti-sigma factor RsiW
MDMDHLDAKRLQAAEKYVLGELTPELRDEYEEHYFDCTDCMEDVKAASAFVDASKEIFREEAVPGNRQPESASGFSGWFAWLRPAIAVPVMAALVGVIVYQNVAGVPGGKDRVARNEAQVFESMFRVQSSTRGAGEVSKVTVGPKQAFALDFDFTPSQTFRSYEGRLVDESGKNILTVHLPGALTNKEVHLAIPGGLVGPGACTLIFVGENDTSTKSVSGVEVQRLRFTVEFRP